MLFAGIDTFSVPELLKMKQDGSFDFSIFTPLTSERKLNIILTVTGALKYIFSFLGRVQEKESCELITVGYPTLFIHWSIVAMWTVFYCSIAITTDFAREK